MTSDKAGLTFPLDEPTEDAQPGLPSAFEQHGEFTTLDILSMTSMHCEMQPKVF